MSDTAPGTRPARKRRKWLIVTTLALVLLSVLALLPVAVQFGLRQWLLDNGGERVQVADVDLNPFTATLLLKGIRVEAGGRDTLSAERIKLDLAWLPLLKKRIVMETVAAHGIAVAIEQSRDGGLRIGGITIPAGKNGPPPAAESRENTASAWQIGIDTLALADIGLRYHQPKLQIAARIEQLDLRSLAAWRPDKAAAPSLQASINGAPLAFEGGITPFASEPGLDGHIKLQDLPLADFQQIVAVAERQAGTLSLQTGISLAWPATGLALQLKPESVGS